MMEQKAFTEKYTNNPPKTEEEVKEMLDEMGGKGFADFVESMENSDNPSLDMRNYIMEHEKKHLDKYR